MTNLLLITVDDMDAGTPSCFGGPAGLTPAIDALAAGGVRWTRAHVAIAVCQPSRSAMLTGRWPHRNGAQGFEPIAANVPLLTDLLRPVGYVVGILGKVEHLQPTERFGWDFVRWQAELGMGRDPKAYGEAAEQFFTETASADQPWFLMANAHDPHRPFNGSDQEARQFSAAQRASYPAPSQSMTTADAVVPGYLPDLPDVRREMAEYYSSCRRADDVVGAVLAALDAGGQADDTLVVFLSDNGAALPFSKANCYLASTATPLVARWPGRLPEGEMVTDDFISALDLFPTFCQAAGVEIPSGVDGRSFLADSDEPVSERSEVFTTFHETHAKRRYEMRCVQDSNWGYIWNAWSDGRSEYVAENMHGRTWPAMLAAAETDPAIAARVAHYQTRTPEELYRLDRDPACLRNHSTHSDHAEVLESLRQRLGDWLQATGDPLSERFSAFQQTVAR